MSNLIKLGKAKFIKGTDICVPQLPFGVTSICAPVRYGKSIEVDNIILEKYNLDQERVIIIFDYYNEHRRLMYPNLDSSNSTCIADLKIINNFAFKISDFDSVTDWVSCGFTDKASRILVRLAQEIRIHNNDPKNFAEILKDFPSTRKELEIFNKRYVMNWEHYTHPDTKRSMMNFYNVMHMFLGANDDRTYIPDWYQLVIKHKHVTIELGVTDESMKLVARAYVGKILERLSKPLIKYDSFRPLIVLEEGDILVPNVKPDETSPSSLQWILAYTLKYQKFGPELILIAQDPANLNSFFLENSHIRIFGNLRSVPETRKLKFDYNENYREFALFQTGVYGYNVFIPETSYCEV